MPRALGGAIKAARRLTSWHRLHQARDGAPSAETIALPVQFSVFGQHRTNLGRTLRRDPLESRAQGDLLRLLGYAASPWPG